MSGQWIDCTHCELDIDVTDAVAAWLANPSSNFGVLLKSDGPVQVRYNFASSERDLVELRPRLRITYAVPSAGAASGGHRALRQPLVTH